MSASHPLSFYRITLIALVLLALTLASRAVLTPALRSAPAYLASESQASAPRSESDAGGQTASPNPSGGSDQEERMRQLLAQEYEQRFGESDEAIRSALGMRGKVADFVGYNARSNQWLIAESKASNIDTAVRQLQNTAEALLKVEPGARIELRLFLDDKTFKILNNRGTVFGWRTNASGYLGWEPEAGLWKDALVEGVKILVQSVPK